MCFNSSSLLCLPIELPKNTNKAYLLSYSSSCVFSFVNQTTSGQNYAKHKTKHKLSPSGSQLAILV